MVRQTGAILPIASISDTAGFIEGLIPQTWQPGVFPLPMHQFDVGSIRDSLLLKGQIAESACCS